MPSNRPQLFDAHIVLRLLLTGRTFPPLPFTPINACGLPLLVDAPEPQKSRPLVASPEFAPLKETSP